MLSINYDSTNYNSIEKKTAVYITFATRRKSNGTIAVMNMIITKRLDDATSLNVSDNLVTIYLVVMVPRCICITIL